MKQEEQMKERILAGATRIYQQDEVNPLLTQQIVTVLPRYEQMFTTHMNMSGLQVSTRVKLYELLETLVQLDNLIVNIALKDKSFSDFIMQDYETFDSNSQVLAQLNRCILAMTL